jgi:hypothetical protein
LQSKEEERFILSFAIFLTVGNTSTSYRKLFFSSTSTFHLAEKSKVANPWQQTIVRY